MFTTVAFALGYMIVSIIIVMVFHLALPIMDEEDNEVIPNLPIAMFALILLTAPILAMVFIIAVLFGIVSIEYDSGDSDDSDN